MRVVLFLNQLVKFTILMNGEDWEEEETQEVKERRGPTRGLSRCKSLLPSLKSPV